jgi:hypothetical protein
MCQPLGQRTSPAESPPVPTTLETVRELQDFLGVINFYRWFVLADAKILKPLTDQQQGSPHPATAIPWMTVMQTAFDVPKAALANSMSLIYPTSSAEISLLVYTFTEHIGAALQQRPPNGVPLAPAWIFFKEVRQGASVLLRIRPQAADVCVQPMSYPAHDRGQEICNFH